MSRVYVSILLDSSDPSSSKTIQVQQELGAMLHACVTPPLQVGGAGSGTKGGSQYAIQTLGEALPYLSPAFCLSLIAAFVELVRRIRARYPAARVTVECYHPIDTPTPVATMTADPASQDTLLAALLAANPHEPILLEVRQTECIAEEEDYHA
ncbi:hypothetical protein [Herpetosiphon llansteffanensis]|uniref:hypothetical protein n=1 Tax=Herpetosiphon llansteffanensis TaxID=2094568 RepID=UPI000D7CED5F|nr:hypothetical protein [Herpetosiphon llansteffanensis]